MNIYNTAVVEPYDDEAVRQALINHGRKIMNEQANQIQCDTTEEHSHAMATPVSTTIHTSSLCESTQTQGIPTQPTPPIQGVSGAQYAPMDTTPQAQKQSTRIDQLLLVLATTLEEIIGEMNATSSLEQAVETTLQQANWFYDMVKETIDEQHDIESLVDDRVDNRLGDAVDEWFSYSFSLTDHCDIHEIVTDVLDDKLEEIVEEKIEALLEEKLANARITVNF